MFCTKNGLKKAIQEVLVSDDATALKAEIKKLKEQLEELKLQKKMEETEIKHLVKLKEEKQVVEAERQRLNLEKEFNGKTMTLQSEYHEKIIKNIEAHGQKMQELHKEILLRLPNVTMAITKKA